MINDPNYTNPQVQPEYYSQPTETVQPTTSGGGCSLASIIAALLIFFILIVATGILIYMFINPDHFSAIKNCIFDKNKCTVEDIENKKNEENIEVTPTTIVVDNPDTADWNVFKEDGYNFTFKYPKELTIEIEEISEDESIIYLISDKEISQTTIYVINNSNNTFKQELAGRIANQSSGDFNYSEVKFPSATLTKVEDPATDLYAYGYEIESDLYFVIRNYEMFTETFENLLTTIEFGTN